MKKNGAKWVELFETGLPFTPEQSGMAMEEKLPLPTARTSR
jgi:hypothetical protein